MIFVTVGTHEQPFNRLIECIDKLVESGEINEEVIMQIGYSTYEPKYCKYDKLISYQDMLKNIQDAHIVITHGGPASFIIPLQFGKIPIVVPRQKQFNEHINNHQLEFCQVVEKRQKNIIVVDNTDKLIDILKNYDELIKNLQASTVSNNAKFNEEFKKIVTELLN